MLTESKVERVHHIRRDSSHCRYRSIHYQREPTRSPAPPLAQRGGKSPVAASLPVRAVRLPAEPRTAQTAVHGQQGAVMLNMRLHRFPGGALPTPPWARQHVEFTHLLVGRVVVA